MWVGPRSTPSVTTSSNVSPTNRLISGKCESRRIATEHRPDHRYAIRPAAKNDDRRRQSHELSFCGGEIARHC